MTDRSQALLKEALTLDPEERADVAAELLASLDGPADPGAEAAWDAEIERRIAAIEAGTIRLEPWATVKQRIEKEILRIAANPPRLTAAFQSRRLVGQPDP